MRVEIDIDESYETMFDRLEELPESDAREELADVLSPVAEDVIHKAFQHHKQNGNL